VTTAVPPPNARLLDAIAALYPELTPEQVQNVAAKTDWHARKALKEAPWICATLKRARLDASLVQAAVATELDWSLSKVVRIETGAVGVSHVDLMTLIGLYRITDPETVTRLVEEARARRRRVWVQQPNVTAVAP
jgi:hypothetical protein